MKQSVIMKNTTTKKKRYVAKDIKLESFLKLVLKNYEYCTKHLIHHVIFSK